MLSPIRDARNQVIAAAVIARDITAHAATEQALAHERLFMRQLIDTVPSMVYVRDGQGRFLIANRAVAEACALDVDQVEGALLADILTFPDDHPRYQRVAEEVLLSGRTLSFDDEFRAARSARPATPRQARSSAAWGKRTCTRRPPIGASPRTRLARCRSAIARTMASPRPLPVVSPGCRR